MASTLRRLAALNRTALLDLVRAAIELALARLRLGSDRARATMAVPSGTMVALAPVETALVDRVAYAIPRVAARVPWRADCLVQAFAARRWLGRHGVNTTLTFGVPLKKPTNFEAHAWLSAGDRLVTGGDISGYTPFRPLREAPNESGHPLPSDDR